MVSNQVFGTNPERASSPSLIMGVSGLLMASVLIPNAHFAITLRARPEERDNSCCLKALKGQQSLFLNIYR